jgi:hypothetical protein
MIEPTKPVNPYENNPYEKTVYGGIPDIPPPPPGMGKRKHKGVIIALVLLAILLLGGVGAYGMYASGRQQLSHAKVPTQRVTPTATQPAKPTLTTSPLYPIKTGFSAPVSATTVFNYMTCSDGPGQCVTSNSVGDQFWNCCKYVPEGGARTWMDDQSHTNVDVATFATPDEAALDVAGLRAQGFEINLVNACVLFYTKGVSPGELTAYMWKMQNICSG